MKTNKNSKKQPAPEPAMSVRDKIRAGHYNTKVPYPSDEKDKELKREKRAIYRRDQARLLQQFKQDAIQEAGLAGHPKADRAYDKAWDDRHSSGIIEVMDELESLAELLLS